MKEVDFSLNRLIAGQGVQTGLVLCAVILATAVRFPCRPFIGSASPFLFYFPVVLAVAAFFGFRLGLFATAASVLPANYFWMAPEWSFSLDVVGSVQMLAFSIAGLSVSWLSECFHQQRRMHEHLRATLASIGDAIISIDCRGRIRYLNARAQILAELQLEEAIGKAIGEAFCFLGENLHSLNDAVETALLNDEIEKLPSSMIIVGKSGARHRVEQKSSRIFGCMGRKLGAVILFRTQPV